MLDDLDAAGRWVDGWEAALAERATKARELSGRLSALTGTANDADGLITVTVGCSGSVVDLRLDEKVRQQSAASTAPGSGRMAGVCVVSYVFEVDDTTVWSPGLRVGALYVRLAECLATWAGVPSGLTPMASDYYIIDVELFKAFVQAVLKDPSFGNPVLGELARGIIATSMVMLSRAAVPLPEIGPGAEPLTELVTAIAAKMPV